MIYLARVMHRRLEPIRYRFVYRVFCLLLDVDRLEASASGLRWLSVNRFNLLSFHERDHGPRDGSALRPWIDGVLAGHGIDLEGGRVRLLAFPRVLGYVFNPISVWYCEHRDGSLRAVLAEVRNTFGQWHGYLLHEHGDAVSWPMRACAEKCFHVSPFMSLEGSYEFRVSRPGERTEIGIRRRRRGRVEFAAALLGEAKPLDDANLLRAFAAIPLMTLKVMAAIHWQALRIWLRGVRFHPSPPLPREEITR